MKRLLPIGIQDFAKIREGGYVYADKTAHIHRLITGPAGAFFLSRPRRFGKSLLCSTLEAVFEGRRELFGEIAGFPALAIDSLEWEWEKHPVIRLDLNVGNYNKGTDFLDSTLKNSLGNVARRYGMELRGEYVSAQFTNLIMDMHERTGKKVAVIIDEYDKPLLDTMTDGPLHKAIRGELKGFYGILKPSGRYLRFVFLTGVTKFAHISIFSDLNHLDDITLDPDYADICGITQTELEASFAPEIDSILKETGRSRGDYMEKLRSFYNGYRFSGEPVKVYNPFGLLKHFKKGD
ncbi:MAG: AAA family ATPase, partial [Treponema sp.]|nr:AAA family ATPase [Treponema sp.]